MPERGPAREGYPGQRAHPALLHVHEEELLRALRYSPGPASLCAPCRSSVDALVGACHRSPGRWEGAPGDGG